MNEQINMFKWSAQIKKMPDGDWLSLFGVFDEYADAEEMIESLIKTIKFTKHSFYFRIIPVKK